MKLSSPLIAICLAVLIQPVKADLISDSEQIMNDAEQVYPQFFPSNQVTQVFDPYRYRFYPSSGIYLGINQNDEGVYLLGGSFGNTLNYIGQTDNVIALLNSQMGGGSSSGKAEICNTSEIPDGFSYRQDGDTTFVTTNGQCIVLPENKNICDTNPETDASGNVIATGINVFSQMDITKFEISGIDSPGFDSIAQEMTNQKICIIHAPTDFPKHTVDADICLDITNQLGDLSAIPGVTPPVTTRFESISSSVVVDDCFTTDASLISNLVTDELWLNQNGSFVKIK